MIKFHFVSSNTNKIQEAQSILKCGNFEIIYKNIELVEYQGDPDFISESKCKLAADIVQGPVIIEDTSLCFNALHGLPGPYIKCFLEKIGPDGLYKLLNGFEDKSAIAVCTLALCMGPGCEIRLFHGKTYGEIVLPRGNSGFGWDACFLPNDMVKTYAEMSSDEKNRISHRYKALMKLDKHFETILFCEL